MRKTYSLNDFDIERLNQIRMEEDLQSDVSVIRFLIEYYMSGEIRKSEIEETANCILTKYKVDFCDFNERLQLATRTAEENSITILDCINTLLTEQKKIVNCVPVDVIRHPIVATSQDNMKRKRGCLKRHRSRE